MTVERLWVDASPPLKASELCCSGFWYPTSFWGVALATGWRQLDYLCATQCEWVYQRLAGGQQRVWVLLAGWGLITVSGGILSWRMKTISSGLCMKKWFRRCVSRPRCVILSFGNRKATVCFQTCSVFWKPRVVIAVWFFALSAQVGGWDQITSDVALVVFQCWWTWPVLGLWDWLTHEWPTESQVSGQVTLEYYWHFWKIGFDS